MEEQFSTEQKNRIRRNLESFKPLTAAKSKAETSELFARIMAFDHPRPRNIEKDLKVYDWEHLKSALEKIIARRDKGGV
ncbi:hypothetical protein HKX48_003016 [Thoreauomyces humboldtii]|nr:hypothetical protein HKX48_003016 [Thoreauomyces humboldtii]